MGLETPLALLGLAAAVLPWLAHRIRRRDLEPQPLPTFALLRRAEARKRRSRGLTDLLLLALRVGIVVAACIAIAAPYVSARLTFGDGRIASAAIVIDDSMSMTRRDGDDTLLAHAVDRARQALASLPAGSEVAVIAAGQRARTLARRTGDLALAGLELDRLPLASTRGDDLGNALKLAVAQLEGARHATRRLLVLSDFATHTGLTADAVRFDGIQVALERVGSAQPPANLYFTSVRALPDPTTKGQTSIAMEIAAYGDAPERVPVTVYSAGREVASAELQLARGRARDVVHVPTPEPDADPTALLRINAVDAIEADNTAGLLLRPSDAVQVMLVNGDPRPASIEDELHYAMRALRLSAETEGALALRAVDASALAKYDLTQVDVLVLANASAPDPAVAERIVRFVQQGGGLIVASGDNVRAHEYNAALSAVLPCRIGARTDAAELTFSIPEGSRLLPAGPSGLSQASARKRLMLECQTAPQLLFSDGAPALAVGDIGRGRSALLATTLDADWSDLPLRPGYLPLLSRSIRDAARASFAISGPVRAGHPVKLAVPPDATRIEVLGPTGAVVRHDDLAGKRSLEFTETEAAGPYRVLASSHRAALLDVPRGAFVVETPRTESDLTPLPGVETWGAQSARGSTAAQVRQSLMPLLLIMFALLVLGEGALRLRPR
jgi:hypothetical protein